MKKLIFFVSLIVVIIISVNAQGKDDKRQFTESFNQGNCTFLTTGQNLYFILEPGYQQTLQGIDGKDTIILVITVLNETKKIGNIETRIVEEHESVNGEVIEISRNYLAFCKETGSIFYFGEDVDIYKNGKVESHEGAWIAGGDNKAGVLMPGMPLIGARYYQEIAPKVAMDRAEIISLTEILVTPAGKFKNVLKTEETTPIEPKEKSYKYYATGVGLIKDGDLLLIKYGFMK
ncbi:MAG: hypothetical protein HW421_2900 [Ignavibacteria bacterium]|nr:hypothetical protein [Ignavibacteria bacterium]